MSAVQAQLVDPPEPFDPWSRCPTCDYPDVEAVPGPELVARTCRRCGRGWAETVPEPVGGLAIFASVVHPEVEDLLDGAAPERPWPAPRTFLLDHGDTDDALGCLAPIPRR